jgi:hypothetical protein
MALAAWLKMLSAARTRVEADAFWSTMIFINVAAAALVACCAGRSTGRRLADAPHDRPLVNSGSFIQRSNVFAATPMLFSGFLNIALGEQGRNGFFFLTPEFRTVAYHLPPSGRNRCRRPALCQFEGPDAVGY